MTSSFRFLESEVTSPLPKSPVCWAASLGYTLLDSLIVIQSRLSRLGAIKIAKFTSTTEPLETSFRNVRSLRPHTWHPVDISIYFKVLMRNLPRHYPHNNVYSLFPFCTPSAAVDCLKQNTKLPSDIDYSDYDCDAPKQPTVHTLTTRPTINHVLSAPEIYNTPYGEYFKKITDGYGYVAVTFQGSPSLITFIVTFLALTMKLCTWLIENFFKIFTFDYTSHDRDQIMVILFAFPVLCFLIMNQKTQTLHALIPDSGGTLRQYAATMRSMTEEAIIAKRNSR